MCHTAVTGNSGKSSWEGTPTPSEKRVWAKKLDPYDTDYTISVVSDGSDNKKSGCTVEVTEV